MNNLTIIKWVQNTDVPIAKIANNTGISRKTLHNIKAGKTARTSTLKKLYLVYQDQINLSNTTLELKGTNMNVDDFFQETETKTNNSIDAKYVIELQKEQLEQKDSEIAQLKSMLEENPFENTAFDQIKADFITSVEVKFTYTGMQRRINQVTESNVFTKYLNMDQKEIDKAFCWGEWFKQDEHPCDKILDKECLQEIKKASKTFPALFNSMKFFVGNFYHTIPIVYNVNNKKLITQCAVKIHWTEKPIRIETKSVILNKTNE
jgi:transcriptional regulator with XRE-family HTH domain